MFINNSMFANPHFMVSTVTTNRRTTRDLRHRMHPSTSVAVNHSHHGFAPLGGSSLACPSCSATKHRRTNVSRDVSCGVSCGSTRLSLARRRIGARANHYLKYNTSCISPRGYVNYNLYAAGYRFSTVRLMHSGPGYASVEITRGGINKLVNCSTGHTFGVLKRLNSSRTGRLGGGHVTCGGTRDSGNWSVRRLNVILGIVSEMRRVTGRGGMGGIAGLALRVNRISSVIPSCFSSYFR